ncbi:MAG: MFS transporter, partial [Anaerolineae bacterium]
MGRLRSGALRYTTVFAVTLLAIEFLDELVFGIREAAWPLIRTDLGLDYAQIGLLLGVPSVVSGLVEPVLGILGDIWRRRLLILGGGAVFALALLLTAQSPGFPALLTASILLYPASGAFVTLSQATLMDTDTARHEQNMARWTFAGSLGVVIGPLALGAAAAVGVLGWRGLFGLSAGLTLILLAIASRFQFAHGRSGPQRTDFRASMMDALQALQRGGVLRWLTLLQFSDLMMDVLLGFLALYLVDVGGAAPYQASAAVAVWTGLGLLGDLLLIPLLGRVRGLAYLRFSAAVELAVFAAFLLVSGIWTRLVLLGLLGLFNALFSGPVRSLLDRSLGMIHGRQRGLRIKLHIDPEDPSLAQLTSLPWEFLYRKETRDFLNLSRFTPILRYLDVQRPYTPLPLEPPLRILVVISAPIDYAVLDLHRERALIEASWARQEGVQVEFMAQATILALQDRLGEQPCHVLHYMGHGDFDERTGQGVLVMEDEGGRGALVDGSTLGVLLRDLRTMRLVFLNACETAKVTKEKGLDPFAGVAAAMVMAGIPAVVAMQFPISDGAAITFAQKFYPLLARGDPVDAAVAEGRRAIRLAGARTMEWGTPVLFMRAPQGVIFEVSEAQRAKVPLPEIPTLPEEMDEELEQRLAELYTRGLSAFWLEEWEKAARSFQAIVGVRPDYEDAADKLAEAKRQAKLHELYAQAQAAQEAENWSGSLAALEALAAEAVDYKDTAAMLEAVRKQKQLADLYAEAQRLHQAQQWQAVVNVLARIHAIEPDYADPDELLPTAEREAAEQKREARLDNLYSRAVRGMNAGRWQEARQLLAQVQEMEPGFRETERLLARVEADIAREEGERRRQEQIATLYEQALGLARDQQWQQVLATMEEIQGLDPQFADPEGLTARAQKAIERQRRLNALYAQAQAAQEADNWSGALSALEELVGEAADFRDAADLLEAAKKQKLLADLYAEAQQFHQAQQWQAVVNTFAQIHAIEPDYPDPEGLLSAAKREDAELKRQAELNDLYSRAVREMDAGRWQEARQLLAQVQEMEPGFREAEQLLVRAEEGIEREETERRRQEQTATLYEQALGLARARQWRQVLMKM